MNAFSTHLNTLSELIKSYNIKSVFEFGCGLYSTNLFIENCDQVYSCEMQSKEWYKQIKERFKNKNNFTIQFFDEKSDPGENPQFLAIDYLKSLNKKFDLIFVDGHKDSRWICINTAKLYSNIIVTHDTEDTNKYHWHRINLGKEWKRVDDKILYPWTSYWIKQ